MSTELMSPAAEPGTRVRCPGCGSSYTTKVATAAGDNLLCKTCGTCWHTGFGPAARVDVRQCPGCSLRRVCTAAQG